MKDLTCESFDPKQEPSEILKAYADRIFKLTLKESFLLLYEMRFCSKRTYHPDGRTTHELDSKTAEKLEKYLRIRTFDIKRIYWELDRG